MTFLYDSLSYTTTHDLELIVKKHMEDCKSGVFQEQAKNNEEASGIPASSNRLGLGMCYNENKRGNREINKMNKNERMFPTQSIIFVIVIAVAVFITIPIAHGQTMTQQQRESLLDYCFQHADRPNPIDDLIDKGFLSSSFRGKTCLSHTLIPNKAFIKTY